MAEMVVVGVAGTLECKTVSLCERKAEKSEYFGHLGLEKGNGLS